MIAFNYEGSEFPVSKKKKIIAELKYKTIFALMYSAMKMD